MIEVCFVPHQIQKQTGVCLVISPLKTLTGDHKRKLGNYGLSCFVLTPDSVELAKTGMAESEFQRMKISL
jgi:superfamily II DNA helicase RecQ